MRLISYSIFALSGALLAGCATSGPPPQGLVLETPLTIPGGTTRAKFQHGKQTGIVDRYSPYCEFEVNRIMNQPQTVAADRFQIVDTGRQTYVDDVTKIPLLLGGPISCSDPLYYRSSYRLRNDNQPNARSFGCVNVGTNCNHGYRYLSTQEMQSILGPRFELETVAP